MHTFSVRFAATFSNFYYFWHFGKACGEMRA